MEMRTQEELHGIVIIGGGISGLATALGLHKKGMKSVVLERSETLRNTGAAIAFFHNGWHAFDHLGVGDQLRAKSTLITEMHTKWVHKDGTGDVIPIGEEGLRCVKRSDIVDALADSLPSESIRFGCRIVAVETDPVTSFHAVHLEDGSVMRTKVLIGCDGSNSVVAKTLGLKPPNLFRTQVAQAVTSYPNGHGLSNHFLYLWGDKLLLGRVPIDEKTVYWFVVQEVNPKDFESKEDSRVVRDLTVEALKDCPAEVVEMVKRCRFPYIESDIMLHGTWHSVISVKGQ
ncbi:uncharacterized protein A4U43_C09F4050 [Asparagus officinalis]|uniref:FAD-binding domain-containing protein n=1 Tax=Asparagus officinalis TaxID=4686 RepID=A0A5P1E6Z8_ASPOF|nr:uncharacterized protein A4U43_C09F4050 [Asparagus officinalis]